MSRPNPTDCKISRSHQSKRIKAIDWFDELPTEEALTLVPKFSLASVLRDGYAIIPAISPERVAELRLDALGAYNAIGLEHGSNSPFTAGGILKQFGAGTCSLMWDVRTSVREVFQGIWGVDELVTSLDGFAVMYSSRADAKLHLDRDIIGGVQAYLTLASGGGGTRLLLGSHHFVKEFREEFPEASKTFHALTLEQLEWFKARGCEETVFCPNPGELFVWPEGTVHAPVRPKFGHRIVAYVTMAPSELLNRANAFKRIEYFCDGRTTSHDPLNIRVNGKKPNLRSKDLHRAFEKLAELPIPVLTLEQWKMLAPLTLIREWFAQQALTLPQVLQ